MAIFVCTGFSDGYPTDTVVPFRCLRSKGVKTAFPAKCCLIFHGILHFPLSEGLVVTGALFKDPSRMTSSLGDLAGTGAPCGESAGSGISHCIPTVIGFSHRAELFGIPCQMVPYIFRDPTVGTHR